MAVITGSNSFNSPKDILNNSFYRYNSDLESISLPNDYSMEEDDKLIANYEREEQQRDITSSYNNASNVNFTNQKEQQLKNNYGNIATLNLKNRWNHRISSNNNVNLSAEFNISSFDSYPALTTQRKESKEVLERYENPFTIPVDILRNINNYRFNYKEAVFTEYLDEKPIKVPEDTDKSKKNDQTEENEESTNENTTVEEQNASWLVGQRTVPSLFNPLFSVQINGNALNTPLLYDVPNTNKKYVDFDIHNCTIKELVRLSNAYGSPLGNARYRFTDFMYCKDLGKVSNNQLITLRKFPYPVPDNIFRFSTSKYSQKGGLGDLETTGDVGRLITWFGTEDNKLEDILKYNYKATWKQLNSKIDQKDSKEDSGQTGMLGMAINSFSPSYLQSGLVGTNNIWSQILSKVTGISPQRMQPNSDQYERQKNYDKNKVYTPKNTIQDTHIYEGKLQFSQDISLKFCYKLRGYENINGKSAMLDLLGNILEVTYRRGKFWGGANQIIGPPPNAQGWKKANAFIDKSFDKLGGIFESLANGSTDLSTLLAQAAQAVGDMIKTGVETVKNAVENAGGVGNAIKQGAQSAIKGAKKLGVGNVIKQNLKNAVGRPAFYAFDSLLPSGLSGLWHLTVGNPKNPIAAIGNLIMDSAEVTHSGPLGIDDFPTELTVIVKLKHAKSRDITNIGKMYTAGNKALYSGHASADMSKLYGNRAGFSTKYKEAQAKLAHAQKLADAEYKAYEAAIKVIQKQEEEKAKKEAEKQKQKEAAQKEKEKKNQTTKPPTTTTAKPAQKTKAASKSSSTNTTSAPKPDNKPANNNENKTNSDQNQTTTTTQKPLPEFVLSHKTQMLLDEAQKELEDAQYAYVQVKDEYGNISYTYMSYDYLLGIGTTNFADPIEIDKIDYNYNHLINQNNFALAFTNQERSLSLKSVIEEIA